MHIINYIRSHSRKGNYKNNLLFSELEGNVKTAFEAFTSQYQCNVYCEWFQLERLTTVELEADENDLRVGQ